MRPQRRPISSRAAPSSAREDLTGPAAKKTQSPGFAPTCAARPAFSSSLRFLATGPPSSPSSCDEDVGEPLGAALLGPLLPGVELLARLARSPGHDHGADVRRLEDPERGVREVLRALGQLEVHAQVGLVGAVARHRLGVGHPRDRGRDVVADQRPDGPQHVLGERDDVVLLDEAHLDVELGELRLPVGAEVLVAVAAGDLEVALHAGDHQQLLEQLRALRQGVPAAGLQPRGHQEVAGALGGGPGQRRGLDLDEAAASCSTSRAARLTSLRSRIAAAGPERRRSR